MKRIIEPKSICIIHPFDFEGVQLLDGRLKDQFEQVRKYFYSLPNDDILKKFREEANLPAPGKILGGWGGQANFGQWLSAFARMYKATNDTAMRDKAVYLVDEWAKTIAEESGSMRHYTFDKLVCGLVDMWKYVGYEDALHYLERIMERAEKSLDRSRPYAAGGEWYTLSENLYRAYEATGDKRYFDFAKVWEYTDYWRHFARKEDIFRAHRLIDRELKEVYHAYSHVNTFSGAAMAYKLTGERHYLDTIINAYEFLQDTQCYATGGYGPDENLIIPDMLPDTLRNIRRVPPEPSTVSLFYSHFIDTDHYVQYHFETACGSWAAFKLARYLMEFTGEACYGDWIERLIYNGVGALLPMNESGMIMYGSCYSLHGAEKTNWAAWSCCTGTLPQDVAEYHNLIYFYDKENLYINLFVPSKVEWNGPDGKVAVMQETRFPEEDTVLIRVQPKANSRFGLKFRVPGWAKNGVAVKVNNVIFETETVLGKWATIDRRWSPDDTVTLQFDLSPRIEPLKRYASPVAILCGPVVMVLTMDPWRILSGSDLKHLAKWLRRHGKGMTYSSSMQAWDQTFRPFYELKEDEPYRMYFERPDGKSILNDQLLFHNAATDGEWFSDGTIYYAEAPDSYFEAKFNGTTLVWEGMRREDAGIAHVNIDGKKTAEVDQYGSTSIYSIRIDQREVPFRWSISNLDEGEHTIRVMILPNKNPFSQGTKLNVRRLIIYP